LFAGKGAGKQRRQKRGDHWNKLVKERHACTNHRNAAAL
jgi:hypothetical protein